MKKSKKVTALFLTFVLSASLAACGGSSGSSDSGSGNTAAADNTAAVADNGAVAESDSSTAAEGGDGIETYFEDIADGITVTSRDYKEGAILEYKSEAAGSKKKSPAGTVVVGGSNQVTSADPHTQVVEYPWTYNVYESLLQKNSETGDIEPCLATEYYYDEDGLLHFILREGVKFHDGNTMTAEDVMFSIQRAANAPKDRARDVLKSIDFDNSQIIDDYHVAFAFKEPCGAILSWMTSQATAIMSKAFVEEVGEDYAYLDGDAGTGAYKLVSTVTNLTQEFDRFEDWWGGCPEIEHVTFRKYEDYTAEMIDFENGDLDYSNLNTLDSVTRFINGEVPDTTLLRIPAARSGFLYMCQIGDVTPFTDIRLRQALAYCVDWDAIIKAVYGGSAFADRGYSCFGPGTDGYVAVGAYEYNPEKSKELLAECGYSTDNPCSFKAFCSTGASKDVIFEMVQAFANEVGFDMQLEIGKSAQSTEANNTTEVPSEYQLLYGNGGAGCGDVFEYWVGMLAGNGHTGYSTSRGIPDDAWCAAIDNATMATDPEERTQYLQEAQQIAYDEYLTIPTFSFCNYAMCRNYVVGTENSCGYLTRWSSWSLNE